MLFKKMMRGGTLIFSFLKFTGSVLAELGFSSYFVGSFMQNTGTSYFFPVFIRENNQMKFTNEIRIKLQIKLQMKLQMKNTNKIYK